jgi:hypothetical protein
MAHSTTALDATVGMRAPALSAHTSTPAAVPRANFVYRATTFVADLFAPAPVRAYYLIFLNSLEACKTVYSVVVLGIALAVAEWEQPGYLPGPGEMSDMLVRLRLLTLSVSRMLHKTCVRYCWGNYGIIKVANFCLLPCVDWVLLCCITYLRLTGAT